MAKSLSDLIAMLPADERAKIKARAAELVKEEMSLHDLRKGDEQDTGSSSPKS